MLAPQPPLSIMPLFCIFSPPRPPDSTPCFRSPARQSMNPAPPHHVSIHHVSGFHASVHHASSTPISPSCCSTPHGFCAFSLVCAQDTSYWKGEFKWWEGLRHVVISFVLGETVLEADALRWLLLYAAISGVAADARFEATLAYDIFFCLI